MLFVLVGGVDYDKIHFGSPCWFKGIIYFFLTCVPCLGTGLIFLRGLIQGTVTKPYPTDLFTLFRTKLAPSGNRIRFIVTEFTLFTPLAIVQILSGQRVLFIEHLGH